MKAGLCFYLVLSALCMVVAVPAIPAEELVVSAAVSLTDVFRDIAPAFEAAHPGVNVVMNFASSGALYRQITQGAPVDVYASANPKWMAKAVQEAFTTETAVKVLAQNALVLAVPAGNPAGVDTVSDLSRDTVQRIGIGSPATVAAGQYAHTALVSRGMYVALESKFILCEHVRQVLDYLVRGEVDAGFVYRTDAVKAGHGVVIVTDVPLPKPVTYPIAPLTGSKAIERSREFVAFVTGPQGGGFLEARGFERPRK
ncbi:MAG: molybdate ABC transporter substrate-binding protein [Desulfobacterales bacterium]|nr:molybdate ABC transporter substrate-binding protein [Desulfobacterales bacterium]